MHRHQRRTIATDLCRLDTRARRRRAVLENILLYNSTGLGYDLGEGFDGEVKFVSAVTLRDVLAPFDRVDLLEADMQHSEIDVFPPFIDVRRVHIGTHGREAHDLLRALLLEAGWDLVFDYAPDASHMIEQGSLDFIDGVLSARNPALANR
jgi:hypothetical protein